MKNLKEQLNNYKFKEQQNKVNILSWQEYAIRVCDDFNITGRYRAMIFKYAKSNMSFLQGKVENTKEKFGTEKLENKGNYLISLFRKKAPWNI